MQAVVIAYAQKSSKGLQALTCQACANGASLICADNGAETALAWGLQPQLVLGDMDSLSPTTLTAIKANRAIELIIAPVEKDETDLELALRQAVERGATDIIIVGGLGGRLDHTLGNLYLLTAPWLKTAKVKIVGDHETVYLLRGGESIKLQGEPAQLVSLIPLTTQAIGVQTEGLYYPLHAETLLLGPTRGISNKFIDTQATIRFESGLLLILVSHPDSFGK